MRNHTYDTIKLLYGKEPYSSNEKPYLRYGQITVKPYRSNQKRSAKIFNKSGLMNTVRLRYGHDTEAIRHRRFPLI